MIKDIYEPQYESAEGRALYVIAKKEYDSLNQMALAYDISRQAIYQMIEKKIPQQYASYLGRRLGFSPGILAYKEYVLSGTQPLSYKELLSTQKYFSEEDKVYILQGDYVKSVAAYLKENDKEVE